MFGFIIGAFMLILLVYYFACLLQILGVNIFNRFDFKESQAIKPFYYWFK